ncbi:carboxylesterase family protein [Nonomuraea sp. NPDC004186]
MRQLGIDPAGGDTIWPSRQAGERIAAAVAEPVACTDATRTMPCPRTVFGRAAKRVSARYPDGAHGSPSLAWAAIATDRGWTCPTLSGNRLLARKTAVYQYEFADSDAPRPAGFPVPRTFPLGAYHGAELSCLFDGLGAAIDTRSSSGQRRLADQMIGYWTDFAATGNPNGPGLPPLEAADQYQRERCPHPDPGWTRRRCRSTTSLPLLGHAQLRGPSHPQPVAPSR